MMLLGELFWGTGCTRQEGYRYTSGTQAHSLGVVQNWHCEIWIWGQFCEKGQDLV